jgi:predicted homoserine dehydrogenase-like protein
MAQLRRDMRSGESIGNDHSLDLLALMQPATAIQRGQPLPLHMGNGNLLKRDLASGAMLTMDAIVEPQDSVLWRLRREQDAMFLQ